MHLHRSTTAGCLTAGFAIVALAASGGCQRNNADAEGAALPAADHLRRAPAQLDLGHSPTAEQVAAIDIDANPAGVGLPGGQGTYTEGAAVFAQ